MKAPLFRLQYEMLQNTGYSEPGSSRGAKLFCDDIADPDVRQAIKSTMELSFKDMLKWIDQNVDGQGKIMALPLTTRTPEALRYRLGEAKPSLVFVMRPLHTIEMLDEFLAAANNSLNDGGYIVCHTMTAVLKRCLIKEKYPWGVRNIVIFWQYLWHRVCPKLRITRRIYFAVTDGKNRSFNRVEVLGRLYRAGFEVDDEQFRVGEFFVVARKVRQPIDDVPPTGSPIIHLRRIGLGGNEIVVHKFRTMYSYSEYIQPYVYRYQNLQTGGKFKDDYRVSSWGKLLRTLWLDELPMLWNLLRGDVKLVGVRPLSAQYFSLYTAEMQQLHIVSKPGLLPPYYYERQTPQTLDEVQASERRYIEAYLKSPFRTDWRYFWGIVGNIIFHRKRSA